MNKTTRYAIIVAIIAVLVGLFIWYKAAPGPYDSLANCLRDKGVKFYGAFWCPHCQAQKQMFSKSAAKLPYIECSAPDGKSQLPICTDAGVSSYPTWVFPDGTVVTGEKEPSELATMAGCPVK